MDSWDNDNTHIVVEDDSTSDLRLTIISGARLEVFGYVLDRGTDVPRWAAEQRQLGGDAIAYNAHGQKSFYLLSDTYLTVTSGKSFIIFPMGCKYEESPEFWGIDVGQYTHEVKGFSVNQDSTFSFRNPDEPNEVYVMYFDSMKGFETLVWSEIGEFEIDKLVVNTSYWSDDRTEVIRSVTYGGLEADYSDEQETDFRGRGLEGPWLITADGLTEVIG